MCRQTELRVLFLMALEARLRVFSRIVNKDVFPTAGLDVFASGTMAGLTSADTMVVRCVFEEPAMNTSREEAGDLLVAIFTFFIADEMSPVNLRREDHLTRAGRGTGKQQQASDVGERH